MGKSFCPVWGDEEDEKTISTQGVALGSVIADLSGRNTSPRYRHRYRPRHRHCPRPHHRHHHRYRHRYRHRPPSSSSSLTKESPVRLMSCWGFSYVAYLSLPIRQERGSPLVIKDKPVFLLGSGILAISLCFLLE